MKIPILNRTAGALMLAAALLAPLASHAAAQTYAQDATLVVSGQTLTIKAGSQADSLTVGSSSFTVTVAEGEAFIVRTSYENPMALENDAGLATCNVLTTRENQLIINGPRTATVSISTSPCSTANYSTNTTAMLTLNQPNGGETLAAGNQYQVFWQAAGSATASVRLRLSTDGGLTYPTLLYSGIGNGFFQWTVPTITTTTRARLKLDGIDAGNIKATDVSNANFTINGTAPAPEPEPQHPAYDPAAEIATATTIDANQSFAAVELPAGTWTCQPGSRIKGASNSAVYYCGQDRKRHPFPNQRIHDSWYSDFSGVTTLTDAELAAIPLGANVTYRPGVRMLKIQTDPKVYAVAKGGVLRWVPDEWTAKKLYGNDWNTKIDDLTDAFFTNYTTGEQVPAQ